MITGPDCLNDYNVHLVTEDIYEIGSFTISTADTPVKRGPRRSRLGLEPNTLDITISTGGTGGPGAALKAAAIGSPGLEGVAFVYSRTYSGTGGGTIVLFTGTVQRVEPASATVRIVAMTPTVDLSSKKLPARLVLPSCAWVYGGTECGHTPSGPTDYCGKTWADCTTRSNTARFGGFPEVKKPEDLYIR